MNEQPKFLRPELIPPPGERVETPANKAERAIGSTKDLVDRSTSALSRSKKEIGGLREGTVRGRLEKRQEILTGRLSGFKKKVAAALAGLALTVGIGRNALESVDASAESPDVADKAPVAEKTGDLAPDAPEEEEMEEEEEAVDQEQPPAAPAAQEPPDPSDPFDLRNNPAEVAAVREASDEEKAAEEDEKFALKSYADLVVDEWTSDSGVDEFLKIQKSSEMYAGSREKADEIGADLQAFDATLREAVAAKFQDINKRAEESPDSLTAAESKIYHAMNDERLELEAQIRAAKAAEEESGPEDTQDENPQERG